MKKLNLILASALIMGAVAVNAQDSGTSGSQDRTGTATQDQSGAGAETQKQSKHRIKLDRRDNLGHKIKQVLKNEPILLKEQLDLKVIKRI